MKVISNHAVTSVTYWYSSFSLFDILSDFYIFHVGVKEEYRVFTCFQFQKNIFFHAGILFETFLLSTSFICNKKINNSQYHGCFQDKRINPIEGCHESLKSLVEHTSKKLIVSGSFGHGERDKGVVEGQKDIQLSNSTKVQANEMTNNSDWKHLEKDLYLKGVELFGKNRYEFFTLKNYWTTLCNQFVTIFLPKFGVVLRNDGIKSNFNLHDLRTFVHNSSKSLFCLFSFNCS